MGLNRRFRAIALTQTQPDRLEEIGRESASLRANDVMIEVHACGFNPSDVQFRAAASLPQLPLVLGAEVAGRVAEVGTHVSRVAVGDRVFAYLPRTRAGYAERVVADECFVARQPAELDARQAAACPVAGLTALWMLERIPAVRGQCCLIVGPGGGVGSMLVPLALTLGLRPVLTAGSPASAERLRQRYGQVARIVMHEGLSQADWARALLMANDRRRFPLVFDLVGSTGLEVGCRVVDDDGHVVSIVAGPGAGEPEDALFNANATFHCVLLYGPALRSNRSAWLRYGSGLDRLSRMIERGIVPPPPVQVVGDFQVQTVEQAHRQLATGRTSGKLVMDVLTDG